MQCNQYSFGRFETNLRDKDLNSQILLTFQLGWLDTSLRVEESELTKIQYYPSVWFHTDLRVMAFEVTQITTLWVVSHTFACQGI